MNPELACWNCGQLLEDLPLPISRHANCQKCYEVLHCCRFCLYYDKNTSDACIEDQSDPPSNKESANFCEYFKPNSNAFHGPPTNQEAKSNLDALFGESDASDTIIDQAKSGNPLDDLFDN